MSESSPERLDPELIDARTAPAKLDLLRGAEHHRNGNGSHTHGSPSHRGANHANANHGSGTSALDRDPQSQALVRRPIDQRAVEDAARQLLIALGADLEDSGLRDTPRRMAASYAELLTPVAFKATTFPNEEHYDQLVLVRDIPFQSLCMHHVLPFYGVAHVGYLPGERIIGLSKLARVVEMFARDLQLQERLTTQVAGWLQRELQARGVGVVIEAEHMCMTLRGVRKPGAKTVTSTLSGLLREDPRTREEFMSLTGGRAR